MLNRLGAALILVGLLPGASPSADLAVSVTGLRSLKGEVQVCLTTQPTHFPDCQDDPAARRLTVAARDAATLRFPGLSSGSYALALIHDENGNDKLDTRLGIPREGVGFSRNPTLMFGPPRFSSAQFAVTNQPVGEQVRMKYFL